MNKKSIVIILVFIILLLIIGFMAFNQFNYSQNQIKIEDVTLVLPEGFHEGTPNKEGHTNITNGYDTLFIKKCGSDNINKYTKQFVKDKQKENASAHIKKLNIGDKEYYKGSITNKTNIARYWFDYNGEVYLIYSWTANKNTDKIVTDIISSLN